MTTKEKELIDRARPRIEELLKEYATELGPLCQFAVTVTLQEVKVANITAVDGRRVKYDKNDFILDESDWNTILSHRWREPHLSIMLALKRRNNLPVSQKDFPVGLQWPLFLSSQRDKINSIFKKLGWPYHIIHAEPRSRRNTQLHLVRAQR